MIVNGATIPDIPADILAKYIYWFIVYVDRVGELLDGYMLYGSNEAVSFAPGSLLGVPYDILLCTTPGYASYHVDIDGEWDYLIGDENEPANSVIGTVETSETGTETRTLVWSNHDIRTVTGFDEATGSLLYGDIYFAKSEEEKPSPTRYSIAKAILDAVARQIMRLTDSTAKVKPEEFEAKLEGLNIQLQELTVVATEEVQTITPPSGVYGFSKVIVEAVEDTGTGGGGTPGGGEGGDDPGDTEPTITNGDNITFGNTYAEEGADSEEYTGNVTYTFRNGTTYIAPYFTGGPYQVICLVSGNYCMFESTAPFVGKSGSYSTSDGSIGKYYKKSGSTWAYVGTARVISAVQWTNHDIYNYDELQVAKCAPPVPVVTAGTTLTPRPVERDEYYEISSDSLNDIVAIAQNLTGSMNPMTLDEAISILRATNGLSETE